MTDALQTTLDEVCSQTQWTVGHVFLTAEDDGGVLTSSGIWHVAAATPLAGLRRRHDNVSFARNVGVPGRVFASGTPEHIADVRRLSAGNADRVRCGLVDSEHMRAVAGFPIVVGDEVCGVLEFFSETPFEADGLLLDVMAQVGIVLGRIVERTRYEAALRNAREVAEVASAAKTDFLSRMSHELRTPLTAVLGYAQLLSLAPLAHQERGYVAAIEKGGNRLLELINDVLDVARLELTVGERAARLEVPAPARSSAVPKGGGSPRVLYVEDNIVNIELIQGFFARLRPGIELLPAMLGELAVDVARQHRPQLILLDVNLPDIDGGEVLRRLNLDDRTRTIPVVIMSADAMPSGIDRFLAAGATGYITKPIHVARLFEFVDRATGGASPDEGANIIGSHPKARESSTALVSSGRLDRIR